MKWKASKPTKRTFLVECINIFLHLFVAAQCRLLHTLFKMSDIKGIYLRQIGKRAALVV